ncbi:MAG: hypothetical protein ACRDGD_10585 [Candidatus Limnocylindria bacterium]
MKCRRICRELLWLARFGELGPSSAPHLDHLETCSGCREEVGFDRALVRQLRLALAARIERETPSPGAWDAILLRAQAPETGVGGFLRTNATALAARLRTASAVSAMALAALIATSTNVGITHPAAGSAETEVRTNTAGERFERQPLVPRPRAGFINIPTAPAPVTYVPPRSPTDPEAAFLVTALSVSPVTAADPAEGGGEETTIEDVTSVAPAEPVEVSVDGRPF